MILPTIHLNGTSKEELLRQWCAVAEHIGQARDALLEAAPNGRDYYPQGPGAIGQAMAEYRALLLQLDALRDTVGQHILGISDLPD